MSRKPALRGYLAGGIVLAAILAAGAAGMASHAAVPPSRGTTSLEAGATGARISGALRNALRTSRSAAAISVSAAEGTGARAGIEGLARRYVIDASAPSPQATFKAVLATGSNAEASLLRAAGARIRGHVGRVVSFDAPLDSAERFAALAPVRSLDIAKRMRIELDVSGPEIGADVVRDPAGFDATGSGVLVANIDTGNDVKHKDFRNANGTTRFRSVLNMDPACRGPHLITHPDSCYFNEARINKFIKGATGMDYKDPAGSLGHGSHTLGIAAGNGLATGNGVPPRTYVGIAPGADLIGVRVFNNAGVQVGDITEALQFLMEEQTRLGDPPLVVNLSLGHQFGAHDGTDPDEIAIDDMISLGEAAGKVRVVAKSAGNSELDGVFVDGTAAVGSPVSHTFTIPSTFPTSSGGQAACGTTGGIGNDLMVADMWYEGDAGITVRVTAPGGTTFFENTTGNDPNDAAIDTPFGTIFVDCPGTASPENGDRECVFGVDDSGGVPPAAGVWTVRITGNVLPSGGEYDAWIALAEKGLCFWGWDNPSSGNSISIPGTAFKVITVGAYLTKTQWTNLVGQSVGYLDFDPNDHGDIAPFSSAGPTRDGRLKPEISAPGMGIASARAKSVSTGKGTAGRILTVEDGKHIVYEGTSMSAPHVAGAAALLLTIDPTLTPTNLRQILIDSAAADSFTGGVPNQTWGAGKLDVLAAANQVRARKRGDEPAP